MAAGTGNLLLMNTSFEVLKEVPLDDGDGSGSGGELPTAASVAWKADGQLLAVNYSINGGCKCLTRDLELKVLKSAAKADPDGGVVQSVSEAPLKNLAVPLAFQPQGSALAGFQTLPLPGNKVRR